MKRYSRIVTPSGRREGVKMVPTKAKTIIYRYNEDAKSDEEEFDPHGQFTVPKHDALIARHGKLWRTVHVEWVIRSFDQIPMVRVFLTDLNIY